MSTEPSPDTPDPDDRRQDGQSRDRIGEIAHSLKVFANRTGWYLRAFTLLFIATIVAVVLLFHQINVERHDNVLRACQADAKRYDDTVAELDERLAKLPPEQQPQAQQSRDFTVALIERLSPKVEDCDALADKQVPGWF